MDGSQEIQITVDPVASMTCSRCNETIDVQTLEPFSSTTCPACSTQQVVPARLGPFLLLSLINTGGMGCVYLARDEGLGRLVAIKVMLSSLGEDPESLENFKREAQAAARLNHPNIAQIHSFGQEHGQPYIVMELVSGKRFDRLIGDKTPLDPGFVLRIGEEIAEGLRVADEIGLVHGDIKPENILLDEKMKAKLVDFGIATFAAERQISQGIWGTPYYIAPEKVRRQKIDARADIYSLGATLFHAIAGKPPFDGETPTDVVKARLEGEAPPLSEFRKGVPEQIANIIARMLQSQPSLRYPTYASLLSDMKEALQAVGQRSGSMGGPRTKRVVLKKKGGATVSSAAPRETAAAAPPPTGKSTRLTIRKGTAGRVVQDTESEESTPPEPAQQKTSTISAGKVVAIVFAIILTAALSVGGIFLHQHRSQIEAIEQEKRRRKVMLLEQLEQVPDIMKKIQGLAADVVLASVSIRPFVEVGESLAESVFGQTLSGLAAPDAGGAPADGDDDIPARGKLREVLASMSRDAATFSRKVDFAREVVEAAEETAGAAKPIPSIQTAKEYVAVMQEYQAALKPLKQQMNSIVLELDKSTKKTRALKSEMDRVLEQRRIEEEKKRATEALEAKRAAQLAAVVSLEQACRPLVLGMEFDKAVDRASRKAASLDTDPARQNAKNLVDRYKLLAAWKKFLVDSINEKPYQWGWQRSRTTYEDILAADEKQIRIRTAAVLWTSIPDFQLVRIVEHYLPLDSWATVRSKQFLATAVWFAENGKMKMADPFLTKSVGLIPSAQKEAERLMPTVEEEPEGESEEGSEGESEF